MCERARTLLLSHSFVYILLFLSLWIPSRSQCVCVETNGKLSGSAHKTIYIFVRLISFYFLHLCVKMYYCTAMSRRRVKETSNEIERAIDRAKERKIRWRRKKQTTKTSITVSQLIGAHFIFEYICAVARALAYYYCFFFFFVLLFLFFKIFNLAIENIHVNTHLHTSMLKASEICQCKRVYTVFVVVIVVSIWYFWVIFFFFLLSKFLFYFQSKCILLRRCFIDTLIH